MRVAVTSQNFRTVTAHAGKARRFIIFDVSDPARPQVLERLDLPPGMAFHDHHDGAHPIAGVRALITGSAGEGLVRRLAQMQIEVVVCGETDPLRAVNDYLVGTVKPPLPQAHQHPA